MTQAVWTVHTVRLASRTPTASITFTGLEIPTTASQPMWSRRSAYREENRWAFMSLFAEILHL